MEQKSGSGILLIRDEKIWIRYQHSGFATLKKGMEGKKQTGLLCVGCRAENSLMQAATPIMKRAAPTLMPITPGTREY
jgi:hypothetical protein